jgi:hypothetical protein
MKTIKLEKFKALNINTISIKSARETKQISGNAPPISLANFVQANKKHLVFFLCTGHSFLPLTSIAGGMNEVIRDITIKSFSTDLSRIRVLILRWRTWPENGQRQPSMWKP